MTVSKLDALGTLSMFLVVLVFGIIFFCVIMYAANKCSEKKSNVIFGVSLVVTLVAVIVIDNSIYLNVNKTITSAINKEINTKFDNVKELVSNDEKMSGTFVSDNDTYSYKHEKDGVVMVFNETKRTYSYLKISKL